MAEARVGTEGEDGLLQLRRALAALPGACSAKSGPSTLDALAGVADALVPAHAIELATIRLLDEQQRLHLVAACGLAPGQALKLALAPLEVRRLDANGSGLDDQRLDFWGLRWLRCFWLRCDGERLGTLTVGSRSDRRPDSKAEAALEQVADELACGLRRLPRTNRFLLPLSLELGRRTQPPAGDGVLRLRPRERTILSLYAYGLGTQEIAKLLVLSPHTVRTHVRNALRQLGVSSRGAAAELVAASEPPTL